MDMGSDCTELVTEGEGRRALNGVALSTRKTGSCWDVAGSTSSRAKWCEYTHLFITSMTTFAAVNKSIPTTMGISASSE